MFILRINKYRTGRSFCVKPNYVKNSLDVIKSTNIVPNGEILELNFRIKIPD